MRLRKQKTLRTKLLKRLRSEAYWKLGVFKFEDGKYRVVYDKTLWNDVSGFDEKEWKRWGEESHYQVFDRPDEVCDTLEEAKHVCDYYRRQYILNQVREMKMGNVRRMY